MSDFIREVDEDYRRDKALEFWKTYGWMILLAVGIIILGVAGYSYYENAQQQKLEAQATAYVVADQMLVKGREDEAVAGFEAMLAGELSPGYRALASFRLAEISQSGGNTAQAAAMYDKIAGDTALPETFRDLATLSGTNLLVDELTSQDVMRRLSRLTASGDFQYSANELIGLSFLREGKKSDAIPYFRQIRDAQSAPQTMRARAQTLLASIDVGGDVLPDVSNALIEKEAEITPETPEMPMQEGAQ